MEQRQEHPRRCLVWTLCLDKQEGTDEALSERGPLVHSAMSGKGLQGVLRLGTQEGSWRQEDLLRCLAMHSVCSDQ